MLLTYDLSALEMYTFHMCIIVPYFLKNSYYFLFFFIIFNLHLNAFKITLTYIHM